MRLRLKVSRSLSPKYFPGYHKCDFLASLLPKKHIQMYEHYTYERELTYNLFSCPQSVLLNHHQISQINKIPVEFLLAPEGLVKWTEENLRSTDFFFQTYQLRVFSNTNLFTINRVLINLPYNIPLEHLMLCLALFVVTQYWHEDQSTNATQPHLKCQSLVEMSKVNMPL